MRKSICFIGLNNYPIMNPDYTTTYIGGESVQQSLLAKAFSTLGWEVSMIVLDYGQPNGEMLNGVRMIKTFRPHAGIPVLRFLHPRITSLWRGLKQAHADVYYHSCAEFTTGLAAHYCLRNGKRLVFRIAHDTDCIPGQQLIHYARDRRLYEYGLRRAEIIYAQSDVQRRLLRQHYGLNAVLMPMAVESPAPHEPKDKDIDVLWVNNIRGFKRPERYLELARSLPDRRFVMIGGPVAKMQAIYDQVRHQAKEIPNLQFMGFVPYSEVNTYYARARLFVNTSESEGFPNSFLQAWIRGVPVVSFFDPDGVIASEGLGAVPGDAQQMSAIVEDILESGVELSRLGRNVREYAMRNHAPVAVARVYETSFAAGFAN